MTTTTALDQHLRYFYVDSGCFLPTSVLLNVLDSTSSSFLSNIGSLRLQQPSLVEPLSTRIKKWRKLYIYTRFDKDSNERLLASPLECFLRFLQYWSNSKSKLNNLWDLQQPATATKKLKVLARRRLCSSAGDCDVEMRFSLNTSISGFLHFICFNNISSSIGRLQCSRQLWQIRQPQRLETLSRTSEILGAQATQQPHHPWRARSPADLPLVLQAPCSNPLPPHWPIFLAINLLNNLIIMGE